jgi:hypothetical protein
VLGDDVPISTVQRIQHRGEIAAGRRVRDRH